jgi:hypothetical protein
MIEKKPDRIYRIIIKTEAKTKQKAECRKQRAVTRKLYSCQFLADSAGLKHPCFNQ